MTSHNLYVPSNEYIYETALLVMKGWRKAYSSDNECEWIHPQGKTCRIFPNTYKFRYGGFEDDKIDSELWTQEDALIETGYYDNSDDINFRNPCLSGKATCS